MARTVRLAVVVVVWLVLLAGSCMLANGQTVGEFWVEWVPVPDVPSYAVKWSHEAGTWEHSTPWPASKPLAPCKRMADAQCYEARITNERCDGGKLFVTVLSVDEEGKESTLPPVILEGRPRIIIDPLLGIGNLCPFVNPIPVRADGGTG